MVTYVNHNLSVKSWLKLKQNYVHDRHDACCLLAEDELVPRWLVNNCKVDPRVTDDSVMV